MTWDATWDVELAETFAGVYGEGYEKVLLEDALRRHCEQILQAYWDKKETVDQVLTKIEAIGQPAEPPKPVTRNGFGPEYKQLLADLFRKQWSSEPETLNRLLAALEE
jgi:hypothetical protein